MRVVGSGSSIPGFATCAVALIINLYARLGCAARFLHCPLCGWRAFCVGVACAWLLAKLGGLYLL